MAVSPNGSTNTKVFGNVKMVWKFEGYHPTRDNFLQIPSFWKLESAGTCICSLQASCGQLTARCWLL